MKKEDSQNVDQAIFQDYVEHEIKDFQSLPLDVQSKLFSAFQAGLIVAFHASEPLIKAVLLGKNALILKQCNDENRSIVMPCDTKLEAEAMHNDFNLYMQANVDYLALLNSTKQSVNVFKEKLLKVNSKVNSNVVSFENKTK